MTIQLLLDRVLVRRSEEVRGESDGGIIIPETAKIPPSVGRVVAVGPGGRMPGGERVEMAVCVGDEVLFGRFAGAPVMVDGEELLIMCEADCIMVTGD